MDEPQKTGEVKPEAAPAADGAKPAEAAKPADAAQTPAPAATPPAQSGQPAQPSQPVQGGATPPPSQPKKGLPKGLLFGLIGLLVVGLAAGAYFMLAGRSASTEEEETAVDSSVVETLTADQLGLSIEAKPDGKAVKFKIEKAGDIKSLEYQVTYEADSTAQEKAEGGEDRVQRGITGEAEVEGDRLSYESEWLDLGSCSRNVCKYDSGVDSVELTLKIMKKNGRTYESQATHELTAGE